MYIQIFDYLLDVTPIARAVYDMSTFLTVCKERSTAGNERIGMDGRCGKAVKA
jgi:hypothetical protein